MVHGCYAVAMRMLVRREHSVLELEQKLLQKEYDDIEISEAIDLLIKRGYQSDERFSAEFIRMRFGQGKGPVKIKLELKQRGIKQFEMSGYDWGGSAKDIKVKKYGEKNPSEYSEIAKQKRFLQSRGFELDQINSIY